MSPKPTPPSAQAAATDHRTPDSLVVGVGASAGGLDASRKLFSALPDHTGMAFILIQHLDPHHDSLMVDLLSEHTKMKVVQAVQGAQVEAEHIYVIPPGAYLAVAGGALQLSEPQARDGARAPFDFLLNSLALEYGSRAVAVVLSGTGADGSDGVTAIAAAHGLVIAQEPTEAEFDGMPCNAVATGCVELVLPVAAMPDALARYARAPRNPLTPRPEGRNDEAASGVAAIIELLHTATPHDFRQYKTGTLTRRIERRIGLAGMKEKNFTAYLERLNSDPAELNALANDLLINVTSFFRDPDIFDLVAHEVLPGLIHEVPTGGVLRIWVAGCSTGEEAYSLGIIALEAIATLGSNITAQIFATDIDADAVAQARLGLYPATIDASVSKARLERFFVREGDFYRVCPALRATIVFSVQNLLMDPPFSRLDLLSCRNLLIYLQPEAQFKAGAIFQFALRPGGFLLLGAAETVSHAGGAFVAVSKKDRIYRRSQRQTTDGLRLAGTPMDPAGSVAQSDRPPQPPVSLKYADICRKAVLDAYAPACVMVNERLECVYSIGPVHRFLSIPVGEPTWNVVFMAHDGLRSRLRSALQQAGSNRKTVQLLSQHGGHAPGDTNFRITISPVANTTENYLLVSFLDEPERGVQHAAGAAPHDDHSAKVALELSETRSELHAAIRDLELANIEHKATNDESLSIQEEYQSTNEELLTSKEELQSLNEELTALNSQLQETLERQRVLSNDLQNVLYSTRVATLFLDKKLNIRFFTPATTELFNLIPSDVGRPLDDMRAAADDPALLTDAESVLRTPTSMEREVAGANGSWYRRRIFPYLTTENDTEGVVITFDNVTTQHNAAVAIDQLKIVAERANLAKSRFLAAASHDLRQPLQTLSLVQELLTRVVDGDAKGERLVGRMGETLGAMAGMLNTLLDINQIEAGAVQTNLSAFSLKSILTKLSDEFSYHAHAKQLELRLVQSDLTVTSDARLLEQIMRNIVSNALKYTNKGKILIGCRRSGDHVRLEVWDTGIGISPLHLDRIFEEYEQLDNDARESSKGLGLGLSIVHRLGELLAHPISVRSVRHRGTVFCVELPVARRQSNDDQDEAAQTSETPERHRSNSILLIEDDPAARDMLQEFLEGEGHFVKSTSNGPDAISEMSHGAFRPDLILADYNLPGGMSGLETSEHIRGLVHFDAPIIILTGDISTALATKIADAGCLRLSKPVKAADLKAIIANLVVQPQAPLVNASLPKGRTGSASALIYLVDDDAVLRAGLREILEDDGREVVDFASCEDFLRGFSPSRESCLLLDASLPGMSGLDLLAQLKLKGFSLPIIMVAGGSDVHLAVDAMKAGATDFIEKPVGRHDLFAAIDRALGQSRDATDVQQVRTDAASHISALTSRQREIMDMVLAGHPSKNIAADLGISQRTVENHRAAIMHRTGARSIPALARLAVLAASLKSEAPSD